MQIRLLQLAVLLICLSGCIDRHTNTPAFYVWKSKLSAEDADTAYLNTLGVQKIYARMFDVDNKGNGAFPTADYSPSSGNPDFQQEVVPVIFITNQTILQCPAADIEKSENIFRINIHPCAKVSARKITKPTVTPTKL